MRKKVLAITITCAMAMNVNAQIYPGDTSIKLPTMSLYDPNITNMYLRALAETAAQREENYYRYYDLALEASKNKQWSHVIYYVNEALDTHYYSCEIYYLRGRANEELGKMRAAKKDYKNAYKYGCEEAAEALESLKAKKRQK